MKKGVGGFVTALLVATLSAIISPIVVSRYQDWQRSSSEVISYDQRASLATTSALRATMNESKDIDAIHQVFLTNAGQEDLDNLNIQIVGSGAGRVLDAGDVVALNDAEPPVMQVVGQEVSLNFKLMKRGDIAALWVKTNSPDAPVIRSSRKGLKLRKEEALSDLEPAWMIPLIVGLCILLGIILGMFLGEAANRHVLRKVGLDPKEVQELYADAVKQRKGSS
jgi:uncharacterized protein YneF (UPF0154 family)